MHAFYSTRNNQNFIPSSKAIIEGLAKDGGLYLFNFNEIEKIDVNKLMGLSYQEMAYEILSKILDDYSEETLKECINNAYDIKFKSKDITPLVSLKEADVLELFQGPTSAFKDLALTLLPHLLTKAYQIQKKDGKIYILTATSGDTGKAALEGFKDVPNTYISVFYPLNRVSFTQERQMLTTTGSNTNVIGVHGNFDDCQRIVKSCYKADELKDDQIELSSANSINLGRLVPQIVYYFYAYVKCVERNEIKMGDPVNFSVPCGNFGNVLAGYCAKQLGLPVNKFICASNANNVLTDFINTGIYDRNRPLYATISPSMDILVSSNVERLLYFISQDSDYVVNCMNSLTSSGKYELRQDLFDIIRNNFSAYYLSDEQTKSVIKEVYQQEGYCLDPHSAIAYGAMKQYNKEVNDGHKCIVLATASCFKFSKDVLDALCDNDITDEIEAMNKLSQMTGLEIPSNLIALKEMPVLHHEKVNVEDGIEAIHQHMIALRRER